MNKQIKLLFIISVSFMLFSSLAYDVEAKSWSLFGWIKSVFAKKNIQQVQAQPIQNNNYGKSSNNKDDNFLNSLKDKCIIKDRILNYCHNTKTLKQFKDINNPYWRYNQVKSLTYGNSMSPLINPGTQLMAQKYLGDRLYSCEIIKFKNPKTGENFIHRIIGKDKNGNLVTRGDNNKKNDYEIIASLEVTDRICGKYG